MMSLFKSVLRIMGASRGQTPMVGVRGGVMRKLMFAMRPLRRDAVIGAWLAQAHRGRGLSQTSQID